MHHPRAPILFVGALAACAMLLACSDDRPIPTQPSPGPPSPPGPTAPVQPAITSIVVDGPGQVPPGETGQYSATARYSDGSRRDVTSEAQWSTSDESVLSVTGASTVVARARGEAEVRARLANHGYPGVRSVIVLPAGQFKLWVKVTEDQVTAPIFDVRVEVVSGPEAGLAVSTDWTGSAVLFGVPADAQLRLTKEGYTSTVHSMRLDGHRGVSLQMFPSGSRLDLPGQYQLTITSGVCADGNLPDAVKTRTYTARMWNAGLMIHVELSGADFAVEWCPLCFETRGNRFMGQTQALDARFTLFEYGPPEDGYDGQGYYPSLAERLPDGRFLSIAGRAIVAPSADGYAGSLDGTIAVYDSLSQVERAGRALASCRSNAHRFTLVR